MCDTITGASAYTTQVREAMDDYTQDQDAFLLRMANEADESLLALGEYLTDLDQHGDLRAPARIGEPSTGSPDEAEELMFDEFEHPALEPEDERLLKEHARDVPLPRANRKRTRTDAFDPPPLPDGGLPTAPSALNLAAAGGRTQTAYGWALNPAAKKKKTHHTAPMTELSDSIKSMFDEQSKSLTAGGLHGTVSTGSLIEDSEFFLSEGDATKKLDKKVQTFQLNQGPHTMAHVALDCVMEFVMPGADEDLQARIAKLEDIMHIVVEAPNVVADIVTKEVAAQYENASEYDRKIYYNEDYKQRIQDYLNTYTEVFNDIEQQLNVLYEPTTATEGAYDHVLKRLDEVNNLHPYATYAWQRGGKKASKGEIKGKGERGEALTNALAELRAAGPEKSSIVPALKLVASALSPLMDGVEEFADIDQFKRFLIDRRLALIFPQAPEHLFGLLQAEWEKSK